MHILIELKYTKQKLVVLQIERATNVVKYFNIPV